MKKNIIKNTILILMLFLTFNSNAFALDYTSFCSAQVPEKNFKGNLASLTGTNFLARNIGAHAITKELKKTTNSKINVKISNFYGVSLTDGIFKSLNLQGKNIKYEDMLISNFSARTLCQYNHIQLKDDKLTYVEPMVLGYDVDITNEDLNKTLNSEKFQQTLKKVNGDKFLSSLFKIENLTSQLSQDKLSLNYKITPLPKANESLKSSSSSFLKNLANLAGVSDLIKPVNVKMSAGLKVVDNKIEFCDFMINSNKVDYSNFAPLINLFNPMNSKIQLDKYNEGDLKIDSIKINPSKISVNGVIIVQDKGK